MQAIEATALPAIIQDDHVELRMGEVGDMTVSFISLKAGTDLSPQARIDVLGFEGTLGMHTLNGDLEFEAGQAFYWAPGHAPFAITDCRYVDFSPTHDFADVIAHITGG